MRKDRHQPASMVAHNLVNQLSAIVGHCDLLIEITEQGTEPARRLALIREIATAATVELTEHQRQLRADARNPDGESGRVSTLLKRTS
jgi:hypothetical protein